MGTGQAEELFPCSWQLPIVEQDGEGVGKVSSVHPEGIKQRRALGTGVRAQGWKDGEGVRADQSSTKCGSGTLPLQNPLLPAGR